MKTIVEYIGESQKSKKKLSEIRFNDLNGPLTYGQDKDENPVIIIGKSFTNDRDEQYIIAKEIVKNLGYDLDGHDIEDIYNKIGKAAEDVDRWVFALISPEIVECTEYGGDGVKGYHVK